MNTEAAIYYLGELRNARAALLADAEGWHAGVTAIERLGAYLNGGHGQGLGEYRGKLAEIAQKSNLSHATAKARACHVPFDELLTIVCAARNAAAHEGTFARHLADKSLELITLLEAGVMLGLDFVGDIMVRNPICAESWQPISHVRHLMLKHSFSFLPIKMSLDANTPWRLVSDGAIAKFVASAQRPDHFKERLSTTIAAAKTMGLDLPKATTVGYETKCISVALEIGSNAYLVTQNGEPAGDLLGIVTAFDLL